MLGLHAADRLVALALGVNHPGARVQAQLAQRAAVATAGPCASCSFACATSSLDLLVELAPELHERAIAGGEEAGVHRLPRLGGAELQVDVHLRKLLVAADVGPLGLEADRLVDALEPFDLQLGVDLHVRALDRLLERAVEKRLDVLLALRLPAARERQQGDDREERGNTASKLGVGMLARRVVKEGVRARNFGAPATLRGLMCPQICRFLAGAVTLLALFAAAPAHAATKGPPVARRPCAKALQARP